MVEKCSSKIANQKPEISLKTKTTRTQIDGAFSNQSHTNKNNTKHPKKQVMNKKKVRHKTVRFKVTTGSKFFIESYLCSHACNTLVLLRWSLFCGLCLLNNWNLLKQVYLIVFDIYHCKLLRATQS